MAYKGHIPWNKGKQWNDDVKRKISVAQVGKRLGKENQFFGKHHTEETKEKLRQAQLGRKHVFTEEHKRKIGLARSGERSNFWKGGLTKKIILIKSSYEYKKWRKVVFERDKYTCIWCGDNKGGNLEADHIKPQSKFPKLIFEVSNGRTLCKSCHQKTDTYGFKLGQPKWR